MNLVQYLFFNTLVLIALVIIVRVLAYMYILTNTDQKYVIYFESNIASYIGLVYPVLSTILFTLLFDNPTQNGFYLYLFINLFLFICFATYLWGYKRQKVTNFIGFILNITAAWLCIVLLHASTG